MDVRDNFKSWCVQVNDGEIVRISRPKNQDVYLISSAEYTRLSQFQRVATYGSYFYGKDKITNLKRLQEIANLKNNWNNNGASAFNTKLIDKVRALTISLTYQPEIFPTANDSIQLEWDKCNGEYLEIEVSTSAIDVFRIDTFGHEVTSTINDIKECNSIVKEFFES